LKALASMSVGGVLIAVAIMPVNTPYASVAAYLEWAGAFLAFTGFTLLFGLKPSVLLGTAAFIAGSLLDGTFVSFNPIGWTLTNYMVYVHTVLGVLTGLLMKREAGIRFEREKNLLGKVKRGSVS